ncbi:hypothetical protein MP228_008057 [Amoeboaphelidium protococcarum]|nr:hypothetical protein MP228_008057 [Amoeboaphelidium protococcarum]
MTVKNAAQGFQSCKVQYIDVPLSINVSKILNTPIKYRDHGKEGDPEEVVDEYYEQKLAITKKWLVDQSLNDTKVIIMTNSRECSHKVRQSVLRFKNVNVVSDYDISHATSSGHLLANDTVPLQVEKVDGDSCSKDRVNNANQSGPQKCIVVHYSLPHNYSESLETQISARRRQFQDLEINIVQFLRRLSFITGNEYSVQSQIFLVPDASRKYFDDVVKVNLFLRVGSLHIDDDDDDNDNGSGDEREYAIQNNFKKFSIEDIRSNKTQVRTKLQLERIGFADLDSPLINSFHFKVQQLQLSSKHSASASGEKQKIQAKTTMMKNVQQCQDNLDGNQDDQQGDEEDNPFA